MKHFIDDQSSIEWQRMKEIMFCPIGLHSPPLSRSRSPSFRSISFLMKSPETDRFFFFRLRRRFSFSSSSSATIIIQIQSLSSFSFSLSLSRSLFSFRSTLQSYRGIIAIIIRRALNVTRWFDDIFSFDHAHSGIATNWRGKPEKREREGMNFYHFSSSSSSSSSSSQANQSDVPPDERTTRQMRIRSSDEQHTEGKN